MIRLWMDLFFEMEKGLHIARKLMVDLVQLGLPLAGESAGSGITRSTSGSVQLVCYRCTYH